MFETELHGFFHFEIDQLTKIHQHYWKASRRGSRDVL